KCNLRGTPMPVITGADRANAYANLTPARPGMAEPGLTATFYSPDVLTVKSSHPAFPAPYPQHGLLEHAANVVVGSAAAGIAATIVFAGERDKFKHALVTSAISGIVSEATGKWWAGVGAAMA